MYEKLMQMSGQKCYTLVQNREAKMEADGNQVTITYPKGGTLVIPREMVEIAIATLGRQGFITDTDVHENITMGDGPTTDRLLSVLRMLPGVGYVGEPKKRRVYILDR